ncbi:MAG TPA: carboxypeptidase-like regulatory domain-containing protein [Candidatus Deferrimicrobiaceae bacterium]|nr:carboxypeptidase-like regulatory domain-containing protein [Candidatus Deferrimicrobiaceae bacterium]
MVDCSNSSRSLFLTIVLCFSSLAVSAAPRLGTSPPVVISAGGYRIAGTVVSKADGRPLARARITVRDAKDPQKFEFIITSENGKFEFNAVPAGKYSLAGAKRGFISAGYDQHDQFSTAIVTGAGLDTETLVLRLAPDAVISGKVLDESNEPVRQATVTLYYDDHSSGVDQIRQFRSAQTNDLGEYELSPLRPGTYFLSASGKPWYAIHPRSDTAQSEAQHQPEALIFVDRALDVAYPVTYYPDVTEADDAMPIPIRGGERVEADIHFNPVPSLRILFHVPDPGNHSFFFPQIQQPAFDGFAAVGAGVARGISSGLVEVTGIPAGHYNVHLYGPGQGMQMSGVDFTKDGDEIDVTKAEAASSLKFSVQITEGEPAERLSVSLRSGTRTVGASQFDSKGEAELQQVAAGRYEVLVWGPGKRYSVAHMAVDGAQISGHTLSVAAGSSPSVSLAVVTGNAEIRGTVTRAGKGVAGAMVVLVPKNPEADRDLFRRDQSDLDGTFLLQNVIPGSYTLLAIENGWDLEWSQPGVIASYLKHGRRIEVGNQGSGAINVTEAIEVQSR